MKLPRRMKQFLLALLISVSVALLFTGNLSRTSGQQRPSRTSATRQIRDAEAMTTARAVRGDWASVSKERKPFRGAEEEEEEILSNLDPETLERLKRQPYTPPGSREAAPTIQGDPAEGPAATQSVLAANLLTNFESIDNGDQLDGFIHRPPDCAMAAGPNHVVAVVNSLFVIYSRSGVNQGQASLVSFFNSVCPSCKPFDPRIVYDSLAGRWIMMAVNGGPDTPGTSNYLVAASQTSDPTGSWWFYSLNAVLTYPGTGGVDTWADFPQLGFDGIAAGSGGAVYITSNQFTFGANPISKTAALNILPKSSLYSGAALNYWRAFDHLNSDGSQSFTLSPALTYGNPGGEFLINNTNNGNFVSLWKVVPTYPPTPVNWTLQSTNTIGSYSPPPDAIQPGGCARMATNDNRISSNAVWRNNKIYAAFSEAHNWGSGTVSAIRYVQLNTSTNATEQNITYGADGLYYFFPAVATDSSDNVVIVFASANGGEFGSVRYTGRLAGDPANTLQASAVLKTGNLCITGARWGDYFSAAVDPADSTKVWIYGGWAEDVAGISLPWDWGTWLGQVSYAPPPPARTLTVASSNPGSGVAVTVTPNDNNILGNGTTQFTRTYYDGISVTLTAPAVAGGNIFQKWQRDGTDWAATPATSVAIDANHTMTAVYVLPPFRIDSVSPVAGRDQGGQQIRLIGALAGLSTVKVGGVSATWSFSNGTSEVTVTTPAHAVGAVSIDVTPTAGGTFTKTNAFAYLPTTFTDDTLVAGVTTARAQHIIELRQAVDALRAVAGLGPAPWTDSTLLPFSTLIKAVHITELRTNLENVAALLGYSAGSYTDPGLGSGFFIKRVHIEELRQRIRTIAG
ncbi:MAG TPA: hypothetical protein VFD58_36915 [Blastocatellia bacterium]|nr:hypothetical protein [Blastocatellia bacterium]